MRLVIFLLVFTLSKVKNIRPADNEKHMRGRLESNWKKDRYATNVKEDVNPLNYINTQHKILPNLPPKKDEQETSDRFSLRIGLPPGIRPPSRKKHRLRKIPPKREPPPIVGSPQEVETPPKNIPPPKLAPPPPIKRSPPEVEPPPIMRPPLEKVPPPLIMRPPPKMGSSPIIRPPLDMRPSPKIKLPPQVEPPAFDEILNFKSDEVFVKKIIESKSSPNANQPSSDVKPKIEIRHQSPLRG